MYWIYVDSHFYILSSVYGDHKEPGASRACFWEKSFSHFPNSWMVSVMYFRAILDEGGGVGFSLGRSSGLALIAAFRLWPQVLQNLSSGKIALPHCGDACWNIAPHLRQNVLPSGFSIWHFGQCMVHVLLGIKDGTKNLSARGDLVKPG
jgi:hypothetical protein